MSLQLSRRMLVYGLVLAATTAALISPRSGTEGLGAPDQARPTPTRPLFLPSLARLLPRRGEVSGVVSACNGSPLRGANVEAYRYSLVSWRRVATTITDAQGRYTLYLATGTYFIVFQPPAGSQYSAELFHDALGRDDAQPVVLGFGSVVRDVNATLDDPDARCVRPTVEADCGVVSVHPVTGMTSLCLVPAAPTPTDVDPGATRTPEPPRAEPATYCHVRIRFQSPPCPAPASASNVLVVLAPSGRTVVPSVVSVGQYEADFVPTAPLDESAKVYIRWSCGGVPVEEVVALLGPCDPGGRITVDGVGPGAGMEVTLWAQPSSKVPDALGIGGTVVPHDCHIVESRAATPTPDSSVFTEVYWGPWSGDPMYAPASVDKVASTPDVTINPVPAKVTAEPTTGVYGWLSTANRCYFVHVKPPLPTGPGGSRPAAYSPEVGVRANATPVDDLNLDYRSTPTPTQSRLLTDGASRATPRARR